MYTLQVTDDELRIVRGALRSYLNDFGHDEVDVLRTVRRLVAKIDQIAAATDPHAAPDAEPA